jgi:hypothetical protein
VTLCRCGKISKHGATLLPPSHIHFTQKREAVQTSETLVPTTKLHCVTTQKTSTWNITIGEASNLAKLKAVLTFNYAPRHEDVWGSIGITPRILNIGTNWERTVSPPSRFTSGGKSSRYPLDKRMDDDEEKNSWPCLLLEPWSLARSLVHQTAQWLLVHSAGLRAAWSWIRVPVGDGNFFLHHRVQTGSGTHPASYSMGTRGSLPEGKAAGAWNWPLTST